MDDALLLTIQETCVRLRCGRSKIYELMAEGRLQSVKLGRNTRITSESTRKLVADLIESAKKAANPQIDESSL